MKEIQLEGSGKPVKAIMRLNKIQILEFLNGGNRKEILKNLHNYLVRKVLLPGELSYYINIFNKNRWYHEYNPFRPIYLKSIGEMDIFVCVNAIYR